MRTSIVLSLLVLVAAAAVLGRHELSAHALRGELEAIGLDEILAFEELRLPTLRRADFTSVSLTDPVTGRRAGHVERMEVDLELGWSGGPQLERITAFRGFGGRVLLDLHDDRLGVERAISELVRRMLDAYGPGEGDELLPPFTFEGLEVLVRSDGWPVQRFAPTQVFVTDHGVDGIELLIVPPEGEFRLTLDEDGLRHVRTRGLPVQPAAVQIIPEVGEYLASTYVPRGRLDVDVSGGEDDTVLVVGSLQEALLDPNFVPVPLGPAEVPFRFEQGELHIDAADVGFDGGAVTVTVEPAEGGRGTDILLHVEESRFRASLLQLVPGYEDLEQIRCTDGGSFELDLELHLPDFEQPPLVEGRGGFHIASMFVDLPGEHTGRLRFEDVVGRFQVDHGWLTIPGISAQCARGGVEGRGGISLDGENFWFELEVEDVDVEALNEMIRVDSTDERHMAGWMSGWMRCEQDARSELTGRGRLAVRAADLMDTPLIEAILSTGRAERQGPDDRQNFSLAYDIRGDKIFVQDFRFETGVWSFTGSGVLRSDLRFDLEIVLIPVPRGLVGDLLELIQSELLVRLELSGTLFDHTTAIPVPLGVVAGPLMSLIEFFVGGDEEEP